MNNITTLSETNFSTPGGETMRLNLPGKVFVMFMMDNCGYCKTSYPIFQTLSVRDKRVTYGVANITKYRGIVQKAANTSTPIKGAPTFILYNDGKPIARYKGDRTEKDIILFLNNILPQLANKNFTPQQEMYQPPASSMQMMEMPQHYQQQVPQSIAHNYPQQQPVHAQAPRGYQQPMQPPMQAQQPQQQPKVPGGKSKDPFVPDGIIPHNAPYMGYQEMNLKYI